MRYIFLALRMQSSFEEMMDHRQSRTQVQTETLSKLREQIERTTDPSEGGSLELMVNIEGAQTERHIEDIEYALQGETIKAAADLCDGELTTVGAGRLAELIRWEMQLGHIVLRSVTTLCQKSPSMTPKASAKARHVRPKWQDGSKRQQEFHQMYRLMAENELMGKASQRPELRANGQLRATQPHVAVKYVTEALGKTRDVRTCTSADNTGYPRR